MSFIPENLVDDIRNASDIVDVVSDYVTLRKRGTNHFGLCPFHPEKTPSFSVNGDKQIFRCFGCGAGGNVFTFVMREESVDFPEAARILAKRAGITIPEHEELDNNQLQEREALYYANELAQVFFHEQIFTEQGKIAREYLYNRDFTDDDVRAFGVGYAPDSWDALLLRAKEKRLDPEHLKNAGLLNEREKGGCYDRFRHRVMFPIINLSGKVVAFGGRRLTEEKESPKYVNSPETQVYHKSNILYGLFQAKEAIREHDRVIFVEGYTDVMRVSLAGQGNIVATSGTALTELQARLIRRYTKNATLLYDSDAAGSAATLRGADILVEQGVDVMVAEMEEGEDPDSFVQQHGIDALREKLAEATPLLDYKTRRVTAKTEPAEKTERLHSIINTLARIHDGIERQEKVRIYAEKLKMAEEVLWEEIARVRKLHQRRRKRPGARVEVRLQDERQKGFAEHSRAVEEEIIRIMLIYWEAIPFIFSFMELTDFYNDDFQLIATVIFQLYDNDVRPEPEEFVHYFTEPKIVEFVTQVVLLESQSAGVPEDYKKWAADCLAKLQIIMLDMRIAEVQQMMLEREKSGGDSSDLAEQWREMQSQRRRVDAANFLPEEPVAEA